MTLQSSFFLSLFLLFLVCSLACSLVCSLMLLKVRLLARLTLLTLSWSLYPGWRADTELVSDWLLIMARRWIPLFPTESLLPVAGVDGDGDEGGDGGVGGWEDGGGGAEPGDITVGRERDGDRLESVGLEWESVAAALSVQPAGSHTGRLGGVRPGGREVTLALSTSGKVLLRD